MPAAEEDFDAVWNALSEPRLAPYLKIAKDKQHALALYGWSTRTASAAFEAVGHLEVLLRNAMDKCLREYYKEDERGIPWFLLQTPGGEYVHGTVESVRQRLQQQEQSFTNMKMRPIRDSRHQIIAGMSFGFWSGLTGPKYEDLWRECLHRAFPNSSGRRKDVSTALERVRKFRNRLAHHDSMINVDVPFELRQIIQVAHFINKEASAWLENNNLAMKAYGEHPGLPDVVIVAAKAAWPLYEGGCFAYVCQAGRAFRHVDRVAFYADAEIKLDIPKIIHRRDYVDWTVDEADRLEKSDDKYDRKVGAVIRQSRVSGWTEGRYQVFLLSRAGDSAHRMLAAPLPHHGSGPGSAYTQRQRYVALHSLETAKSTADLP
jgi:hypothetical protein